MQHLVREIYFFYINNLPPIQKLIENEWNLFIKNTKEQS